MIQRSGQIRCPCCGETLSITRDTDNPYFQCGCCACFFEVSDGRTGAKSVKSPKNPRPAPIAYTQPQVRDQPRRRLWVRVLAFAVVIGLLWFGVGKNWTESKSDSRRQIEFWAAAGADVELHEDLVVLGLTFHENTFPAVGLSQLWRAPHLESVKLNNTRVTDQQLVYLPKDLVVLELNDTAITDAGMKHVMQLSGLRTLKLKNTAVTDAGLSGLQRLSNLEELGLSGTLVSDAGLSNIRRLIGLRKLYLGETKITDEGLQYLRALRNLEQINLRHTQIGNAGLQRLRHLTKLKYLYLGETRVTDAGLDYLTSLSNLEGLNLHETWVSRSGVKKLQARLPKVVIQE